MNDTEIREACRNRVAAEQIGTGNNERIDPDKPLTSKQLALVRELNERGGSLGDAVLFQEIHGNTCLWNSSTKQWHIRHEVSNTYPVDKKNMRYRLGEHVARVKEAAAYLVGGLASEAMAASNNEQGKKLHAEQKSLFASAKKLRKKKDLYELFDFLPFSGVGIALDGDCFNGNKNLLGTPAGIVDLRVGEYRRPDPAAPVTMMTSVAPEDGEPVMFLAMLTTNLAELAGVIIPFLKILLGYALTRSCRENLFVNFFGPGAQNGKSTIMNILQGCVGDYAAMLPTEFILESRNTNPSGHSTHVMFQRDLAIGIIEEVNEGARISTGELKRIASPLKRTARDMQQGFESFRNSLTLFILTNFALQLDADDAGTWRRVLYILFTEKFVDNPDPKNTHEHLKDRNLEDQIIKNEAGKILNWIIMGAVEYDMCGVLKIPEELLKETNELRRDEDVINSWFAECCEHNDHATTQARDLFESFSQWYEKNVSKKGKSQKWFGGRLRRRFRRVEEGGRYFYEGIAIRG